MSLPAVVRRALGLLAHAVLLAACATRQPGGAEVRTGEAEARLRREWVRAADAPPGLRAQLAASPIAFFRFVNHAWTHAVCDAFAADIATMPTARLHGDAHVEQYAVTARTHGLDDFDDSAEGPALVDLVRFLGSLELVAGEKGWAASLPGTIDAFLDGYRRALEDIAYMPPEPAVARRLREVPLRAPDAFLSWAESLMQPPSADERARLEVSWPGVEAFVAKANPEFTPAFMTRKAEGWLRLGIGSALTRKILIRIEGPTPAPDDDLVLEAKEVVAFDRGSCVSIPAADEASRQVDGLRAMGRFPPRLLVALPGLSGPTPNGIGWWVRAWDRSYRELEIADLNTADDLREVARDVGAQLGATNLIRPAGAPAGEARLAERRAIARLESRIRQVSHELTGALVHAWQDGRAR
jgi:hypothetical protein